MHRRSEKPSVLNDCLLDEGTGVGTPQSERVKVTPA